MEQLRTNVEYGKEDLEKEPLTTPRNLSLKRRYCSEETVPEVATRARQMEADPDGWSKFNIIQHIRSGRTIIKGSCRSHSSFQCSKQQFTVLQMAEIWGIKDSGRAW